MKNKAKKLGISFNEDITDEELKELIDAKEDELKNDTEYLKAELNKYKSEAEKAFAKRDALKKDKNTLAKKIKDMESQMKGMVKPDEFQELKDQFESLKEFKTQIDKQKEEDELKKLDEIERVKLEQKKEREKIESEKDKLSKEFQTFKENWEQEKEQARQQIQTLRKAKLDAEIIKVAAKTNAWNPEQVVLLTRNDFEYDDNLNKFTYIKRDNKGKMVDELSVDEYVKDFLNREENENLIKSDVNPGSFRTDKHKPEDKNLNIGSKYNPKAPDLIEKADIEGMTPERYIRTLELRDKALGKE